MKKYRVALTLDERDHLTTLIAAGMATSQKLAHAHILLKVDQAGGEPGKIDDRIADVGRGEPGDRVRQRFVERGLEPALGRKPQD